MFRNLSTFQHIKLIEKIFINKKVLVEKPLFHKSINFNLKKNKYYVGYNLRFHPVIKFLKNKIKKKEIFSVSIFCNSFLPKWRKNIDYSNSYSSQKKGGGVLVVTGGGAGGRRDDYLLCYTV